MSIKSDTKYNAIVAPGSQLSLASAPTPLGPSRYGGTAFGRTRVPVVSE